MASILPETSDLARGMDANRYATKKTIAQGMLDIALLTSNASQLKYVLQAGDKHEFFHLMIVLISVSIILQVVLAIFSISLSTFPFATNTKRAFHFRCFEFLLISLAFLVTVLNMIAQGVAAVFLGSLDINKETHHRRANLAQNGALLMNVVSVIINIMINTMEMKSMNGFSGIGGPTGKDL